MSDSSVIHKNFGESVPGTTIKSNIKLSHNHPKFISEGLSWSYEEIVTKIFTILSIYGQHRVHIAMGEYTKAEEYFNSIPKDDEKYWNARFELGEIEYLKNNPIAAVIYWEEIPDTNPLAYWDAQYALWNLLEYREEDQGKNPPEYFRNIPKWHRRYNNGLFRRGCIAAARKKIKKAAACFYRLPDDYPPSKSFQALYPHRAGTTLH